MSASAGRGAVPRRRQLPVQEPILPSPLESFIWRCDDYPMPWSVWNSHPECEIHLIRSSHGTCHVGDHIGPFAPGDLYLVGRDLPHDWVTPLACAQTVPSRDVLVQFDGDRILRAGEALPELQRLRRLLQTAERGLRFEGETRRLGGAILQEMEAASGLERLSLFFRLLDLLSGSTEHRVLSSPGFTASRDTGARQVLRGVLRELSARFDHDIRLADMAAVAGMTETAFSRFFKRNTGNTFTRHLSELRIGRACQYLAESDQPITEICHAAGYGNLSNFNRTFRALRGMSPREYRRLANASPAIGPSFSPAR